jgi:putative transposase
MPSTPLAAWADSRTPALAIVARGDQIRSLSATEHEVRSQSRPDRKYRVAVRRDRWSCSCAFHRESHRLCIHILAVRYRDGLGDRDPTANPIECVYCHSGSVIRFGKRHNKSGLLRRYLCKECGRRFVDREGFLRRRADPEKIALALDLFYRGLSVRKISEHFHQVYSLKVAPATLYGWIVEFSKTAAHWMDSLTARTGETWHVDETVVTVDGAPRYVWNVLDAKTRFLMATHVTRLRRLRDARVPLRRAKSASPDRPMVVFTDGLNAYPKAIGRELAFRSGSEVVNPHVRVPSIRAKRSNNLVERLHGTEKDRIKLLRGFHGRRGSKTFMEGFRVYYNLVRTHAALGTTPAVAAGLPEIGGFRWKEILNQASKGVPPGQVEIVFVAG